MLGRQATASTSAASHASHPQPMILQSRCRNATVHRRRPSLKNTTCSVVCRVSAVEESPSTTAPKTPNLRLSMDVDELFSTSSVDCPHGFVLSVIQRQEGVVQSARPKETLEDIIPKLSVFTGLPVVNDDGKVVGVISRKDIIRVRKAGGSMKQLVKANMTRPAITIRADATVQEAADLMLQHRIRRLPVVDENGAALGIVSRTDVFQPLFKEAYTSFGTLELEAMARGVGIDCALNMKPAWDIKYLYDGNCSMCQGLVKVLKRNDRQHKIAFVNIQDPQYNARDNMGVELDEAMETIHAIYPDGTVALGTEALRSLFDTVGLGWAARLSELPIVKLFVDLLYDFLSHHRISLGNSFDAIIASKRIDESKKGVETCGDVDEGCAVEW